jgi:hypothetical protein
MLGQYIINICRMISKICTSFQENIQNYRKINSINFIKNRIKNILLQKLFNFVQKLIFITYQLFFSLSYFCFYLKNFEYFKITTSSKH